MRIAVVNAGSATVKGAIVDVEGARVTTRTRIARVAGPAADFKSVFGSFLDELLSRENAVDAVAHRIVHGGRELRSTLRLDAAAEQVLDSLGHLAPLHNPIAVAGLRAVRERLPGCPQIGVFDTAFHADREPESLRYPLPWDLCEELDLLRYGFHGIAHAALIASLADATGVETNEVTAVTLQLGAGSSACAVERGRSIETSMGISPLGGLPMGTRSGDLDPGVILTLLRHDWGVEGIERLLTRGSGLEGMTGTSDMREVLVKAGQGDEHAEIAVKLFVRSVILETGAYLTLLRGEGAIVFGGGIGSGSSEIRRQIGEGLSAWNVEIDPERNVSMRWGRISPMGARPVYVFETDEERLIAIEAHALLESGG